MSVIIDADLMFYALAAILVIVALAQFSMIVRGDCVRRGGPHLHERRGGYPAPPRSAAADDLLARIPTSPYPRSVVPPRPPTPISVQVTLHEGTAPLKGTK